MTKQLDLDDVAAQSPLAKQELEQLREQLKLANDAKEMLRAYAESAWNRGFQMGLKSNEQIAKEATLALQLEKQAHADTNARLTELISDLEQGATPPKS